MRIFLAGASGVLGTRLVPLLIAAGHEVAGMTRSPEKARLLADAGAEPVVCDAYDLDGLVAAVTAYAPDSVMHQLTDLPDDPARLAEGRAANARIRREGTTNLLAAARAAGATRFLAQSVAWELTGEGQAAKEFLETSVLAAHGVVLRYGQFYGPGTYYPDAPPASPRIALEEAAARTVRALESKPGIYEVTEEPAPI
ncbi:NAD-dependent epimerase/dehydratase family protein [Nocardia goodfellowii]|uniref:Nucleoside-diphosphate-sugar epimerase n=1 Tax=Nocardia goodfellowii TaxID=882446 RepID=A0ABS4QND9_9NOCA|nr:NAD-dependent epimerase/dehydratase family protein [Nocardia goodfellowii]MBP2192593.1 nucleoside-diphosphate-sugar epimerase [Nocardia goodfellowii]